MNIQIDSREKKAELERIIPQIEARGCKTFISKLPVGDYMSLDNARLVIDRKKDLHELCGNVCQQHERFKAELVRAMQQDIKIIILCEHGDGITSLEDVLFWDNPRKRITKWVTTPTGQKRKVLAYPKAVNGSQLYKSLCTIRDRYNVTFEFCNQSETGARIVRLLS